MTAVMEREQAVGRDNTSKPLVDYLVASLVHLGVKRAFGIVGGAIAPLSQALQRGELEVIQYRHECAAAYGAVEASLATGELVVLYVTTGPGLLNAVNGLMSARWEGAKVLCISGATSLPMAGRHAAQETDSYRFPLAGLYESGSLFHLARLLQHPEELPTYLQRLSFGIAQPQGFVAHLGLPVDIQMAAIANVALPLKRHQHGLVPQPPLDWLLAMLPELVAEKTWLWAGHGARQAGANLLAVAEQLQWPVVVSPHGKGIFPEDHPLYLGSSGLGGHSSVQAWIKAEQPGYALVLGSKLGENTTYWSKELLPRRQLLHVDVDASVFGTAYPDMATQGICSTVEHVLSTILKHLDRQPQLRASKRLQLQAAFPEPVAPNGGKGKVRPQVLMQAIQTHCIQHPSTPVIMAETGNTFAWALHWLRMKRPKQFRINAQYCSMGHFNGGALGYWLATKQPCVVLTGDGALLMNNEINTAVACGAHIIWIVLNDAGFGMIRQGMAALRFESITNDFPPLDFVSFATAQGATGYRIDHEHQLPQILTKVWHEQKPIVIDVAIDPEQRSPLLGRVESLKWQSISQQPASS